MLSINSINNNKKLKEIQHSLTYLICATDDDSVIVHNKEPKKKRWAQWISFRYPTDRSIYISNFPKAGIFMRIFFLNYDLFIIDAAHTAHRETIHCNHLLEPFFSSICFNRFEKKTFLTECPIFPFHIHARIQQKSDFEM